MNKLIVIILMLCAGQLIAQGDERKAVNELINAWHKAASEADFETYFGILAKALHRQGETKNQKTQCCRGGFHAFTQIIGQ